MLVSIERMENSMSYVNIDWVKNKIDEKRDIAGNWVDDSDVIPVVNVLYWLDCLDDAQSRGTDTQQPKTTPVPSPKPYQHSYTKKEQNTTEEAVNDDKVNKPNHYVGVKGLEVEEVLQNFLPKYKDPYTSHRVGSAIEYQLRSPEKNGLEDLRKARKNLDQAIEYEESKIEHNDTHSINAGGSSVNEMDIDLNEAMRAFANIGSGSGVSITADNLKLS